MEKLIDKMLRGYVFMVYSVADGNTYCPVHTNTISVYAENRAEAKAKAVHAFNYPEKIVKLELIN